MVHATEVKGISDNFISVMNRIENDILRAAAEGKRGVFYRHDDEANKELINLFCGKQMDGFNLAEFFLTQNGYRVFIYIGVNIYWDELPAGFDYDRTNGRPKHEDYFFFL